MAIRFMNHNMRKENFFQYKKEKFLPSQLIKHDQIKKEGCVLEPGFWSQIIASSPDIGDIMTYLTPKTQS